MKLWEGKRILCPTCSEETITIQKNNKGRPFVSCKRFGATTNYNSIEGEDYIDKLVKESQQEETEPKVTEPKPTEEGNHDNPWDKYRK